MPVDMIHCPSSQTISCLYSPEELYAEFAIIVAMDETEAEYANGWTLGQRE